MCRWGGGVPESVHGVCHPRIQDGDDGDVEVRESACHLQACLVRPPLRDHHTELCALRDQTGTIHTKGCWPQPLVAALSWAFQKVCRPVFSLTNPFPDLEQSE